MTCMHIPSHGMSVTGQIYSLVSLFPEWNSFGHLGLSWCSSSSSSSRVDCSSQFCFRLALKSLSFTSRTGTNLFCFGFKCKARPNGDEMHTGRFWESGACVSCFMVMNCSIKSPLPVPPRSPSACVEEGKNIAVKNNIPL